MHIKNNMKKLVMKAVSTVICMVMLVSATAPIYAYTDNGAYIDHFGDFVERPHNSNEYVERLYKGLLNRLPDRTGLKSWDEALRKGRESATSLLIKFTHSVEFERLTRGNELHFIYAAYKTVYGSLDTLSRKNAIEWKTKLENKLWTREKVLEILTRGFELAECAASAGINYGDGYISGTYTDRSEDVPSLILNLYSEFLDMRADRVSRNDIENWCAEMYTHNKSVEAVIAYFYNKSGLDSRNISNEVFIRTIYRAVLGRDADPSGLLTFSKALNAGKSRSSVLYGVVYSVELSRMCVNNGLILRTANLY